MNTETDDCRPNDLTGPRAAPGYMTRSADHGRKNGSLGGKMALHFDMCTTRGAIILPTFTNIIARSHLRARAAQIPPHVLVPRYVTTFLCRVYEIKPVGCFIEQRQQASFFTTTAFNVNLFACCMFLLYIYIYIYILK